MNILGLVSQTMDVRFCFTDLLTTSFLEEVLALGGFNPYNKKAELFSTDQDSWRFLAEYPFEEGLK